MFIRSLTVVALFGCQAKPSPAPAEPPRVEVTDGHGMVVAQLRPGHPCRATIGPVELLVGGPPLVAQNGAERWTGARADNGTTLARDATPVARVFPVGNPTSAGVYDPRGIAMIRIAAGAVTNAGGSTLRHVAISGATIKIDEPAVTVTGTSDVVLAALLTAPELVPEVRMLAACERVL